MTISFGFLFSSLLKPIITPKFFRAISLVPTLLQNLRIRRSAFLCAPLLSREQFRYSCPVASFQFCLRLTRSTVGAFVFLSSGTGSIYMSTCTYVHMHLDLSNRSTTPCVFKSKNRGYKHFNNIMERNL